MPAKKTDQCRPSLWPMPPVTETNQGNARRLGVEIEFAGLEIDRILELLVEQIGGNIEKVSDYEYKLCDASLDGSKVGEFGVELDYAYIKKLGKEREEEPPKDKPNNKTDLGEGLLALLAKQIVPYEIVCPPLEMSQLWHLEDVIRSLRNDGAKGTNHATTYAFGLQLNPEMPDLEAKTILAYLRAFHCLFDWLKARCDLDMSRKMTPYIDPCPKDYLKLIMQEGYAPDIDSLIDDYIDHNPTRNRALDMMPLFAHLDEDRVRSQVDDDRIKPRPTLHYRLPNCQIDELDWGLILPWRDWLQVEYLAYDPDRLKTASSEYRKHLDKLVSTSGAWSETSTQWLVPELL